METLTSHSLSYDTTLVVPAEVVEPELPPATVVYDSEELTFELGVWLVGLQSFSGSHFDAFEVENADARNDLRRRFRIANAALLNISELTCRLGKTSANEQSGLPLSFADIAEIGKATRAVLMLGEALSTARELTYAEWRAWNDALSERLLSTVAARRASSYSLESGYKGIPENLWDHFTASSVKISERIDLDDLLPRLGTGLRFLEVVGRMLRDDEPLKPTLLIFSAVHEQTRKMVDHINNRLTRFPSEDAMLFNSLDSASYSASLELKKVFQQELRGIVSLLPPTSVYARIEAAYSLLLDSYEQILVDLASSIGAKVSTFDSFPRYKTKLDQSLILREHLWQILKSVRQDRRVTVHTA